MVLLHLIFILFKNKIVERNLIYKRFPILNIIIYLINQNKIVNKFLKWKLNKKEFKD